MHFRRFELNDELSLRFDPDGDRGLENECFGGESAHILQSSLDGSEFQLIGERWLLLFDTSRSSLQESCASESIRQA